MTYSVKALEILTNDKETKSCIVKPSPTDAGWFNVYSADGELLSEWYSKERAEAHINGYYETCGLGAGCHYIKGDQ